MALNIFPSDVADELKSYAEKASSFCAKVRFGKEGEADAAKIEADQHYDNFKDKSKGLLTDKSYKNIKVMLLRTAWYAANTRKGCKDEAENDKKSVKEHYYNLIKEGEVSETLATNVREMGSSAARFTVDTIVGNKDQAVRDKANLDACFNKIRGDVNLVAVNFFMNEAKILSEKQKVVYELDMVNNGDIQQTMAFKFSVTEGKTESTSHKIAFSYGVKVRFEAGVFGSAESKYEISFTFSHDHTFSSSISTGHGNTKTYEFPLSVPAHSTYVGKGMVHEAEMDVPYELVFDFGGTKRSVKGIWKGVAVSKATFGVQMNDVADELKSYAEKASSFCAKVRFGKEGEADAAKIEADQHYDNFKDKSKGLLTDKSYKNIKVMLLRTAWYAANTRKGCKDEAENDKKSVKEHYYNLIKEGEVSETLATNVREMVPVLPALLWTPLLATRIRQCATRQTWMLVLTKYAEMSIWSL
ncbi:hypothetical protein OS493_032024 [Desmophyllum pertusum]|uniref:Uncharacterized protein n=1 Tax=Desmophyllum pertusum TaxID=174260 RepID=A0A9W9YW04_9CNID|nr:hypothetical protein OS493_032024 [Desmophyllum pertusum]